MRSEQREFGFRMVEAIHVRPGPHVMAGFASLRCAVGTAPRHAFFEFAMMDIFMAGGAGPVLNGRASCRGRGENSGGAGLLKKKKKKENAEGQVRQRKGQCKMITPLALGVPGLAHRQQVV